MTEKKKKEKGTKEWWGTVFCGMAAGANLGWAIRGVVEYYSKIDSIRDAIYACANTGKLGYGITSPKLIEEANKIVSKSVNLEDTLWNIFVPFTIAGIAATATYISTKNPKVRYREQKTE